MARSSTMLQTRMSRVDLTMTDACDRDSAADPTIQYEEDLGQFQNRVRVLAEVVNDADEISLISTLFRKRGWLVRAPRDGEVHSCPQQNRTWLIIEVRFPGSTKSAAKQAAKRIQLTAAEFRLGLWVRLVQVINFPHEQDAPYYIDAAAPDWLARHSMMARVLRPFGVPRTTGLLMAPPGLQESAIRERLAAADLGLPFDPGRQSIRPVLNWSLLDDPAMADAMPPHPARLVAAGAVGVAACGLGAGWSSGAWKAIPLLAGITLITVLVAGMSHGQSLRQRAAKAFPPTLLFAGCVFLASNTPHHDPALLVATCVGLGVLYLVARGILLALRDSWFTRQASWGIPFAITLLAPLALYLGGAYDTQYLTGEFGIPSDAASVSDFYRLAIAARSVLIGLGCVLVTVAIIGWGRYFHALSDSDRWMPLLTAALTLVVYLLATLSSGLVAVDGAANAAMAAAHAGRRPANYFGIQGTLECLKPVIPAVPVYNAPLPTGRPLLSFGTTSNWLWVWDPVSGRSIGVPLDDVAVTPATGVPAHCQ